MRCGNFQNFQTRESHRSVRLAELGSVLLVLVRIVEVFPRRLVLVVVGGSVRMRLGLVVRSLGNRC